MNHRAATALAWIAVALLLGATWTAPHQASAANHGGETRATQASGDMADGEVRRINKELGKITLRHGEIKSFAMPPMTMVFNVRDPALLDRVKVGDKIRFTAVKEADGSFVVTAITPVP